MHVNIFNQWGPHPDPILNVGAGSSTFSYITVQLMIDNFSIILTTQSCIYYKLICLPTVIVFISTWLYHMKYFFRFYLSLSLSLRYFSLLLYWWYYTLLSVYVDHIYTVNLRNNVLSLYSWVSRILGGFLQKSLTNSKRCFPLFWTDPQAEIVFCVLKKWKANKPGSRTNFFSVGWYGVSF
jgi:hypothetical protein